MRSRRLDSLSCLSTRYNELSSDCVDEIAQAAPSAVGPCTQDARALCEDEFTSASSTTTQCLLEHRDELSDACRTKVDHDASRKPIPTTFIDALLLPHASHHRLRGRRAVAHAARLAGPCAKRCGCTGTWLRRRARRAAPAASGRAPRAAERAARRVRPAEASAEMRGGAGNRRRGRE